MAIGCTQAHVANVLGIDAKTLKKNYGEQLAFGRDVLCADVLGNLAKIAKTGKGMAAVVARKHLLAILANLNEKTRIEIEGRGVSGLLCRVLGEGQAPDGQAPEPATWPQHDPGEKL
jgi:hypothetical protein